MCVSVCVCAFARALAHLPMVHAHAHARAHSSIINSQIACWLTIASARAHKRMRALSLLCAVCACACVRRAIIGANIHEIDFARHACRSGSDRWGACCERVGVETNLKICELAASRRHKPHPVLMLWARARKAQTIVIRFGSKAFFSLAILRIWFCLFSRDVFLLCCATCDLCNFLHAHGRSEWVGYFQLALAAWCDIELLSSSSPPSTLV